MKLSQPHRRWIATLGVIVAGALLLAAGRAAGLPQERYLIIHSDDAGLCEGVNEGTIQGLDLGVISSCSVMVVCPGFEEFADYAVTHPEHDYGVHLTLTSESSHIRWGPLLKDKVPSLVQPDGTFWRSSEQVAEHAQADHVRRELRAQIERALERGIAISHLDHHMWVLLQRPDLLQIYVDLGVEYRLPIRLHRTFAPVECGRLLQDPKEYYAAIQPAIKSGNPLIDFIDADNYDVPADRKRSYFLSLLRGLRPGVSEFVVHCSSNRPGIALPGAVDRRAADARVFTSLEVHDEIRRLGIRVVGWRDLVQLRRQGQIQ